MKEAAMLFLTDAEFFLRVMHEAGPYIIFIGVISLFAYFIYKAN